MSVVVCPACGKTFKRLSVNHVYCSRACGARFRHANEAQCVEKKFIRDGTELVCAYCRKTFTLMHYTDKRGVEREDKRTRFCSATCEKKYWRHPPQDRETSRTNFHSQQEYESWERRTNE